jgi:S1-C subfamily serine protease
MRTTDAVHAAVCRLSVQSETVDVLQPYLDRRTKSGIGTGFVMSLSGRNYVATAMHVVDCATSIHATFSKFFNGKPVRLCVLGANPLLDVALLDVHPSATDMQLSDVPSVPMDPGSSDRIFQTESVSAAGFSLGEKHLQLSGGVVSARKVDPLRVQVDLAVAPGNSGGPLFRSRTGGLIGIITSGHTSLQGLNYAAPIQESLQVFHRIVRADMVPHFEFGIDFDAHFTATNRVLTNRYSHLTEDGKGGGVFVVCTAAELRDAGAVDDTGLMGGDVLHAIQYSEGRFAIDMQSRIHVPWASQPVEFQSVLDRVPCEVVRGELLSDPMTLHVVRGTTSRALTVRLRRPRHKLRELFPFAEPLHFVNRGGVVVQLLNENISECTRQRRGTYMESPWLDVHSVLTITHVAADSPFVGDEVLNVGDFVCMVNNVGIPSGSANALEAYAEAWSNAMVQGTVVTLQLRDGRMSSALASEVLAHEAQESSDGRISVDGKVATTTFDGGTVDVYKSATRPLSAGNA